ncbi:MAG: SPOR domain-containing protein [Rhodobacteraceae bacterium]|nr:SPOR domain-containing protein [Paracoccaceae bacterium]
MTIMIGQPERNREETRYGAGLRKLQQRSRDTIRRIIILLSLIAIVVLVKISVDYYRSAGDIPVFSAEGLPMWHKPTEQGGAKTEYTEFALNRIISGMGQQDTPSIVTLAPQQQGLAADILSPRALRALERRAAAGATDTMSGESAEVPVQGTESRGADQPVTENSAAQSAPESPESEPPLDIGDVIADILSGRSGIYTGVEMVPESVLGGTYVAQVGIYSEREQAANRLIELLNSFPELLGATNWMIEPFMLANRRSHRLRFLGFTHFSDARTFCKKLVTRGVECIPTTVF